MTEGYQEAGSLAPGFLGSWSIRGAGTHQVVWDGTDRQSRTMPSGIYLVRMVTEDGVEARKIVLAK